MYQMSHLTQMYQKNQMSLMSHLNQMYPPCRQDQVHRIKKHPNLNMYQIQ